MLPVHMHDVPCHRGLRNMMFSMMERVLDGNIQAGEQVDKCRTVDEAPSSTVIVHLPLQAIVVMPETRVRHPFPRKLNRRERASDHIL